MPAEELVDEPGAAVTSRADTPCTVGTLMHPPPHRVCGARTRADTSCRNWTVWGRSRCRMHSGASRSGIASPRFRHGRYSRDPPSAILAIRLATET